ncbi:MAG: hypothetical protein NT030_01610 [Candidatus Saganbacteria bacterium]|nr:hypothetical protein [Candidatus Saganbacteria bacterium]
MNKITLFLAVILAAFAISILGLFYLGRLTGDYDVIFEKTLLLPEREKAPVTVFPRSYLKTQGIRGLCCLKKLKSSSPYPGNYLLSQALEKLVQITGGRIR